MIAVIESGSKQYMVEKGQVIETELLNAEEDTIEFKPLLVIDGDVVQVGKPTVENAVVKAKITEADVKGEKITVLKYKAKKRIKTKTGHRQRMSKITITDIKA